MRKRGALALILALFLLWIHGGFGEQEVEKPLSKPQVMLGIRVLKIVLARKNTTGLKWEEMPFKPGINKEINFYRVLKKLKSVGDIEVLFHQSLIGIAGGRIEADETRTIPVLPGQEGSIEVGAKFKGYINVVGDDTHLALDYHISYLYGSPPSRIAKTDFKADVAIGNGQTLVLNDLIVEDGEEKRFAEVLVFISAYIVR